jgi:hypothetical protein
MTQVARCCIRGTAIIWSLSERSGHRSARVLNGLVANDAVDGAHSAASECHRVVASKRNYIEGSRPHMTHLRHDALVFDPPATLPTPSEAMVCFQAFQNLAVVQLIEAECLKFSL